MTCIIGVVDKETGSVFIGGDSGVVGRAEYEILSPECRKVFRVGDFLFGVTGYMRMGQLLRYHFDVERKSDPSVSDIAYIVTKVIPAMRVLFKDEGASKIENNQEEGDCFLLGYNGEVYKIDNNFQAITYAENFTAVGWGQDFAYGAMKALEGMPVRKRILKSLAIVGQFSQHVHGPYYVYELKKKRGRQ